MNFSLVKTKASKLSLIEINEIIDDNESPNDFSLSYSIGKSDDSDNFFLIKFDITTGSKEVELNMEFQALFNSDEKVTEDFLNSHFASVNCPAIVYPYLRSFVSTLTLNAGYEPIMLPTINFVALAKENSEN